MIQKLHYKIYTGMVSLLCGQACVSWASHCRGNACYRTQRCIETSKKGSTQTFYLQVCRHALSCASLVKLGRWKFWHTTLNGTWTGEGATGWTCSRTYVRNCALFCLKLHANLKSNFRFLLQHPHSATVCFYVASLALTTKSFCESICFSAYNAALLNHRRLLRC